MNDPALQMQYAFCIQARRDDKSRWTTWAVATNYDTAVTHADYARNNGYHARIINIKTGTEVRG